jgi:hypothetical protein
MAMKVALKNLGNLLLPNEKEEIVEYDPVSFKNLNLDIFPQYP